MSQSTRGECRSSWLFKSCPVRTPRAARMLYSMSIQYYISVNTPHLHPSGNIKQQNYLELIKTSIIQGHK